VCALKICSYQCAPNLCSHKIERDIQPRAGVLDMKLRLLACAFSLHAATSVALPPADLVFINGAVYTVDAARSWATALAVSGDRITYVGTDAGTREVVGPHTRVIDLSHRMLLPGFQDSHVHPSDSPNPANTLDLHGLLQREQVFERIRQFARAHPERPWMVGQGWDEAAFLPSGQPTRQMLDAVVPDRPAFLLDNSGHEAWANSRALAAAHITAATPDPLNGRIERDAQGEPTGALQEEAQELVRAVVPPPTPEERAGNLAAALEEMARLGITALEDAAADADIQRAYQRLDRSGKLRQRVRLCQLYVRRRTTLRRSASSRLSGLRWPASGCKPAASRSSSMAPTAPIPSFCCSPTATSRAGSAGESCSSTPGGSTAW
jgi:predicted amidohydrolase YtcJ